MGMRLACRTRSVAFATGPRLLVERSVRRTQAREAALTHEVSFASRSVFVPHQDPADRFLAATAAFYDLELVTLDPHLLAGTGFALFNN